VSLGFVPRDTEYVRGHSTYVFKTSPKLDRSPRIVPRQGKATAPPPVNRLDLDFLAPMSLINVAHNHACYALGPCARLALGNRVTHALTALGVWLRIAVAL
jgi:hypothetical protein